MRTQAKWVRAWGLALGLLGPTWATSKLALDGQPYKDTQYGYEIQAFRGWAAICPKPGERSPWQRAWGGEAGQRLEIAVWTEGSTPAYAVEEGEASPHEFHRLYQGFRQPGSEDKVFLEQLEALRVTYNETLVMAPDQRGPALAKCREGYKALLEREIGEVTRQAQALNLGEVCEREAQALAALDPAAPGFAESALALHARFQEGRGARRYLLRTGEMKRVEAASLHLGAVKATRYDFVGVTESGVAFEIPLKGRCVMLLYCASPADLKRALPSFEESASSFKASAKWKPPQAAAEVPETGEGADPGDQALQRVLESIKGVPGWWYLKSKRYIIVTNVKKSSSLPKVVAEHVEGIRDLYERLIPPVKPITEVSIVRICGTENGYRHYDPPEGSAGYWSSAQKELVMYANETAGRTGEEQTLSVLRHEAFHQYISCCMGDVSPHCWLDEGTGDFFSGGKPSRSGDRLVFRIQENDWRNNTISEAILAGTYVPLADFVKYSQDQYYEKATKSLCYAQGWSLVYYLLKGTDPGSPYRKIIPAYLADLEVSREANHANAVAFDGINLAALQRDWVAFYRNTSLRAKVAKSAQIAPIMPGRGE